MSNVVFNCPCAQTSMCSANCATWTQPSSTILFLMLLPSVCQETGRRSTPADTLANDATQQSSWSHTVGAKYPPPTLGAFWGDFLLNSSEVFYELKALSWCKCIFWYSFIQKQVLHPNVKPLRLFHTKRQMHGTDGEICFRGVLLTFS